MPTTQAGFACLEIFHFLQNYLFNTQIYAVILKKCLLYLINLSYCVVHFVEYVWPHRPCHGVLQPLMDRLHNCHDGRLGEDHVLYILHPNLLDFRKDGAQDSCHIE